MFQCTKCGQTGLQSITYIDGIPVCSFCIGSLKTTAAPILPDYSFALGMIQAELKEIKRLLKEIQGGENEG